MSRKRFPPQLELTIESLDREGAGQGWFGAKPVRVKAGLPGEALVARTVGRRKGAALAVTEQIVADAHSERVPAACEFYPRCGGCALQHLSYPAQLEHKQAGLLAELVENGITYDRLREPVASPQFGYRRRARLGVRRLHDMQLVGFREAYGGRIVKMDHCLALMPPFNQLIEPLARLLDSLSISAAVPQLETAAGDTGAALILRHLQPLTAGDARLLGEFQRRHNVAVFTQSQGYDTVMPLATEVAVTGVAAPGLLNYSLEEFGVNLEFSATDFVQVNRHINAALVRAVVAGLRVTPQMRIGDLFCGIGNFSLPLARAGARVFGWEAAATAIERARHNAQRNGLSRTTRFAVADLYEPGLTIGQEDLTALVLDPPRSGAGPALAGWLTQGVERVAYVSCNPTTFASDSVVLTEHGFRLTEVGIFDMFPHTAHVETLGFFERRN